MKNQIINERLKRYNASTLEDEENAIKEVLQEIALYALSTTDFFKHALFHGGTSLRILYSLPRFSEDLDFILKKQDGQFHWESYIEKIFDVFKLYGIEPEITDRSKAGKAVQKLFLKDNSIGKIIDLNFHHHSQRKLLIKLEIDVNPPKGSGDELKYLDFPMDFAVLTQDIASNFSGKCHALLCRPYTKGRDWFDFSWYVSQKAALNYNFLENALNQAGPWQGTGIKVDKEWLMENLSNKIHETNWQQAALETRRFVGEEYASALKLWGNEFFLNKLKMLNA